MPKNNLFSARIAKVGLIFNLNGIQNYYDRFDAMINVFSCTTEGNQKTEYSSIVTTEKNCVIEVKKGLIRFLD
ncbi:MAG: hypothetical protein CV082_03900 [Candidatus Brocadia sp. BL1]|nr:MAG: hypothetical protein CV082_03900 [Candidatus Brocadia sp. BL1]